MSTVRGIRNHNPGNIRWGSPWQGLVLPAQRTDGSFCQFVAPLWGLRAIVLILLGYRDRYGLSTVEKIIGRWAPPNENDTAAYVAGVCRTLAAAGVQATPTSTLDLHSYNTMLGLVRAIVRHENGAPPTGQADWYVPEVYEQALRQVGLVPPQSGASA